jgi:hypothetical protein
VCMCGWARVRGCGLHGMATGSSNGGQAADALLAHNPACACQTHGL